MSKQIWREVSREEKADNASWCNSIQSWLEPYDPPTPDYPPPRDARTDPPKKSDANSSGEVLGVAWGDGITEWTTWQWHQRGKVLRLWMPLPPPIPEQKSEAERAWETEAQTLGIAQTVEWREYDLAKKEFIRGFNAAKKGGGA